MEHSEHILCLPDTNLTLRIHGSHACEDDLARFERLFLTVWAMILPQDRYYVEQHWAAMSPDLPTMELLSPGIGDSLALATTLLSGRYVKYSREFMTLLPDDVAPCVIAHEMGHVYQNSIGKNRFNLSRNDLLGIIELLPYPLAKEGLVEIHADEMVWRWGLDPNSQAAYLHQYYDCDGEGRYIPRKKPRNQKTAYREAKNRRELRYYDLHGSE